MAAPTSPYCLSTDVYRLRLYIENPGLLDFQPDGEIPSAVVDFWISQVASRIDMAYSSAGYTVPFEERSGETWASHQTEFLRYFNSIGVAALIGGDASVPRVTEFVRGRRSELSVYQAEWTRLIEGAKGLASGKRDGLVLLRAATEIGTPADSLLIEPSPPLTDFLEGYDNPTTWDTLRNFTLRHQYYMAAQNRYNQPSVENEASLEYLYWVHSRLGYTYDS